MRMEEAKVNPQMARAVPAKNGIIQSQRLRVGVVIEDCSPQWQRAVSEISHPVSTCQLTHLVVLEASSSDKQDAIAWLSDVKVTEPDKVELLHGQTGFQSLLNDTNVDAVYIIVSPARTHRYIMSALNAKKHVLFYDAISQKLEEFLEQVQTATLVNRFLQSSTMFGYCHRVKTFLDCVLYEKFGRIDCIDAKLIVNEMDAELLGISLPITKGDGCIRRLGRFCVLVSVLILARTGSRPISAQVTECELSSPSNEASSARCVVRFTDNRVLSFYVAYSPIPTRQILDVQARDRYATMTDFVIPHPDGLATYRVYNKSIDTKTGKLSVVQGEARDIMSGPPQDVMMWRIFSDLCHSVETRGYEGTELARELARAGLQTKRILLALEESQKLKKEVSLSVEEIMTSSDKNGLL